MPIVRVAAVLLGAGAALSGCATQFAADPPPGASLAGNWKVDHGAGDDPQKILDQMRAQAYKIVARQQQQQQAAAARPPTRGGAGSPPDAMGTEDLATPLPSGGHRPDPLLRSPMAHIIMTSIDRGDFLTVRQGPGEFVLDYGASQRSFTPGGHSVVSAEGGVGDQTSGWKGRTYVIHVKAQLGPDVTEEYSLSPDGKQLLAKLHIGTAELPAVTLTRVYNPTSEAAPRRLPSSD
jgi:hypothetical protein